MRLRKDHQQAVDQTIPDAHTGLGTVSIHTNLSGNKSARVEIPQKAQGMGSSPQNGTTLKMRINQPKTKDRSQPALTALKASLKGLQLIPSNSTTGPSKI